MVFTTLSQPRSISHLVNLLSNPPVSLLRTCLRYSHNQNPNFTTNQASLSTDHILSLLERCSTLDQVKQIQAQMILSGIISDAFAASRLIAVCSFADPPKLLYGSMILRKLENPNVFSWNVVIRGCSGGDDPRESILLYKLMLHSNARPDKYTYPFLFKACAKMVDFQLGMELFGHAFQLGWRSHFYVINALIHMIAMCGRLGDARKLFDGSCVRDLVSWNTMIHTYVQSGCPREALELFREMEVGKVRPDEVTMIGLVSCCTQLQDLDLGKQFHQYIEENEIKFTVPLTNSLMDMYVKCGSLEPALALFDRMTKRTVVSWTTMIVGYAKFGLLDAAQRVFREMPERDVIPWNALIAGYVQCKRGKEAITLFHDMQTSHVKPNEVTMGTLLSACSQLGALEMGMWVHHCINKHGFPLNVALGTALVDMYAKCGNIQKSLRVFREIPERNALTWTAMICGLASHGHADDAIKHFLKMTEIGLQPDEVTFVGVLSACCHAGLVDEGRIFFDQMTSKYKLVRKLKHYSCMVDLLGRAGLLDEAEELVKAMPMEPDAVVWGALFFACRIHGNVAMGERAALRLLELDPHDSGIYVLLANMYVEANMRDEADKVRVLMRKMGVEKTPGCSSIEVNGMVHEFIARDKFHPECKEIYKCLLQLGRQMEHHGRIPSTS
ncbi:pentatricopeptide repeat-containing protein At2g22410, mitochondrial [Phoenix dactylifera]|uniref:Pentatricopeptide repeat-containing protein At2g22410, mitochondrial n=1 Tax=Phoenix dactylifera TaxID=42345 RepID=A0A8B8J7Y4_PHODC|nr:pentatricopeptide repeat-containing protein At2g22410, mitochondrial [Phoenix dactylifera]XP_017699819.1 pentatricopeptide repeat-containing protein At2g22410, mitochondrial [Phoenix dactylifera]XP_026662864.1 pentatricopeptide repeat-containing protein At2g22410, mitochondrial [Phoenix dactylifera]XP_026662865.1 pentatricopeptide repeat-containing protein At2g22410, mitochondrial [Phoenix dactylifera]XP_026662866.1 pentatricopeptide repeat-containing protein At2g22410, mitochondrial [Phoeni